MTCRLSLSIVQAERNDPRRVDVLDPSRPGRPKTPIQRRTKVKIVPEEGGEGEEVAAEDGYHSLLRWS